MKRAALPPLFILLLTIGALDSLAATPGDPPLVDLDSIAVCNGVADDTIALQLAFAAVSGGGTLVFPPGRTCMHKAELQLIDSENVVIEGNGATLKSTASAPLSTGYAGIRVETSDRLEIRNLRLDGNRSGRNPSGTAVPTHQLLVRASSNIFLSNVSIVDSTADGIYIKGFFGSSNGEDRTVEGLKLIGCSVENSYRNALTIVDARDVQVIGGSFSGSIGEGDESGIVLGTGDPEHTISTVLISGADVRGNRGVGISLYQSDGGVVEHVRIVDNDLSANDRGALWVGGSHVTVQGNHFHDFDLVPGITTGATIEILSSSEGTSIVGNTFDSIDTGLDVLRIATSAEQVLVSANHFGDINLGIPGGSAVWSAAAEVTVSENVFSGVAGRGILVLGDRSVVDGNRLYDMRSNVIWADAEDVRLVNNVVGPLEQAGSSDVDDAVIRTRKGGGVVIGNSVACLDEVQPGIVIDRNPVLVTDNVVEACDPTRWLKFLGGVGSTVANNNIRP